MNTDYRSILTEEVALEGLDGITVQALWERLENRVNFKMRLDDRSKEFLWGCLLSISDLEFYQLETPRGILTAKQPIIIDPESGVTVDYDMGEDLYPIKIVNAEGPVIGSCSTYLSRQCITPEIRTNDSQTRLTLKEVDEKYGRSLVIVGSQDQRFTALCGEELDPSSLYSQSEVNFCILERIGRSRRAGELSIGESSLQVFKIAPKSMFYHTLRLIKLGIVKKQSITVYNKKGQNSLRRLFHLTRFYQQYQSKYTILTNIVANYLNNQPMKRQEISKTRQECGIDQKSFKKLYQCSKRFRVVALPYNEMYPDSPEREWYTQKLEIKMIRVIEVLEEEDDSDDEEDEDGKTIRISKDASVYPQVYERSILRQAMEVLEEAGTEGMTNVQLMRRLSKDSLETRMILRMMERRGLTTTLMVEVGKQKIKVSVSKSFVEGNKLINQINKEKEKLKQSLKEIQDKQENPEKSPTENKDGKASAAKGKKKEEKKGERDEVIENELKDIVQNVSTTNRHFRSDVKATCRQMVRINTILDFIKENKIVDGVYPIVKMVREKERKEKSAYVIDKQTVVRLLLVLSKEKKINIVNTVLQDGSKEKRLQMIMSKDIEPTDQLVKSLIDQAHMKFQAINKEQLTKKNARDRAVQENANIPETARESIFQIMSYRSKLKAGDMMYDVAYSKHYDFRPKYSRAHILHSLLWYLVYGFPELAPSPVITAAGEEDTSTPTTSDSNTHEENEEDILSLIKRIPRPHIYKDEMSWKRFLSPLPKHKGYGEGWFLVSDILLKLPLVVFCNIFYIPYKIRGLKEILEDPERSLYPVISLPKPITQQLLYARKYIFSFYSNCINLCNMGLITIGPQIMKEKDKVFMYLHKKATLLDTKWSERGLYRIKLDTPPLLLEYNLVSLSMVDQYWVDLKHIALNSNLGHKDLRDEEDDSVSNSRYTLLPDACCVESADNILDIRDDGFVPGDKLGAAGLDSSMFPHLLRNWSGLYSRAKSLKKYKHKTEDDKKRKTDLLLEKKNNYADLQKKHTTFLSTILPRPKDRVSLKSREKSPEIIRVALTKNVAGNKGGKGVKRKSTEVHSSGPTKRAKTLLKKVKLSKVKPKLKKFVYDDIDIEAHKRKLSQRVSWSSYEDSLLLTSKIATLVMDRKRRGVLIPWSCIRDVLYRYAPKVSVDKTSCACQRRVTHSLRNPTTKQNLMVYLSEAMQDPFVKKFSEKQYLQASEHAVKEFHVLIEYLINKFSKMKVKKTYIPASLSRLIDYNITCGTHFNLKKTATPEEPTSRPQILEYVLREILHSYVSSASDKQGRSHQMFRLLSQYPDSILDSAIEGLRMDGLIVKNKKKDGSKFIDSGIKNIKLAQRYHYRFHSRYPTSIFGNCLNTIKDIQRSCKDSFTKMEIRDMQSGGLCSSLVLLLLNRQVTIDVEIPPDIVILDSQAKHGRGYNPQMSLAKRARLQATLDSDDEDYPFDLDQRDIRPCVMEQEKTWKSQKKFDGPSPYVYDEDGKSILQFTSDKNCTLRFLKDPNLEESKKGKDWSKITSMCASRALVTMRRSCAEQDQELRHYNIQDNFLIQACQLKLGLSERGGAERTGKTNVDLTLLGIPYSKQTTTKIIKSLQKFVPFELDLEEVWSMLEPDLLDSVKNVYSEIDSAGETGLCHFYLKNLVNNWKLFKFSVGHLLDKGAILRVGTTRVMYISLPHSRPWVIHNYKDTRGRGQVSQTVSSDVEEDKLFISKNNTTSQGGQKVASEKKTTQTKASTTTENSADCVDHPQITSRELTGNTPSVTSEAEKDDVRNADFTSGNRVSSATTQTECVESPGQAIVGTESESVVGEPEMGRGGSGSDKLINSRVGPYTRSKSTKKKPQADADSVAAGPKALSTYEKIRLQIFPWKKPEGYLNKPVFSFMVESILLYIVSNPGISFTNLSGRYNPFLLPCHLRDLLEILEEMECVSRTIVTMDPVLSVFSAYQPPNIVSEPDQSLDNEVFYEATVHSLPLLGQFLEDVQNTDSVQLHRTRKSMKSETGTSSNQGESVDASNHGNRLSIVTGEGMSSETISTQLLDQSGQGQHGSQTLESEQGGGGKDTSRNAQEATVEEVGDPSHEKMDTSGPQSVDQCFSLDVT